MKAKTNGPQFQATASRAVPVKQMGAEKETSLHIPQFVAGKGITDLQCDCRKAFHQH